MCIPINVFFDFVTVNCAAFVCWKFNYFWTCVVVRSVVSTCSTRKNAFGLNFGGICAAFESSASSSAAGSVACEAGLFLRQVRFLFLVTFAMKSDLFFNARTPRSRWQLNDLSHQKVYIFKIITDLSEPFSSSRIIYQAMQLPVSKCAVCLMSAVILTASRLQRIFYGRSSGIFAGKRKTCGHPRGHTWAIRFLLWDLAFGRPTICQRTSTPCLACVSPLRIRSRWPQTAKWLFQVCRSSSCVRRQTSGGRSSVSPSRLYSRSGWCSPFAFVCSSCGALHFRIFGMAKEIRQICT